MDIIWTLLLTVCLNDTCASQTIAWFEEKPQCIAMKLFTDAITGTAAVAKIWLQGLTGRSLTSLLTPALEEPQGRSRRLKERLRTVLLGR